MHYHLLHHLVGEYVFGVFPVRSRHIILACGEWANSEIQCLINLSRTGALNFSPTWWRMWEKQPISRIFGKITFIFLTATLLTLALSRIVATGSSVATPYSLARAPMICLAASSPDNDFASHRKRTSLCWIFHSLSRNLTISTNASPILVVPSMEESVLKLEFC